MRLIDIREATASISSQIQNAYVNFSQMTISVVAVESDVMRHGRRLTGYGFCSNGRYAQGGILRERLIPRIRAADEGSLMNDDGTNFAPSRIRNVMMNNEKPGGHGDRSVAVAALDMAVWDLVAKIADQALWRYLSDHYNGGNYDQLRDEMLAYRDQGYKVLKMKIGGVPLTDDMKRIETVADLVGGADLAVDANGRFGLSTALAYGKAMGPLDLFWFEEPGDPLDFQLNSDLSTEYSGAIATGENLFSLQDARNLLRHGGMRPERDWIQLDPALSYGLTEYLDVVEMVEQMGWSRRRLIPHGGHQFALAMAAGLQLGGSESYPGVFQPFGGFADDVVIQDGLAEPGEHLGIGMEAKAEMFKEIQRLVG